MHRINLLTEEEVNTLLDGISWEDGKTLNPRMSHIKTNEESHHVPAWVRERLIDHISFAYPAKVLPLRFNRYRDGGFYADHADSPFMECITSNGSVKVRTDLSCTIFLTDDYEGGELCFDGHEYKGRPGEAIVYPADTIHHVNPVTDGERICCITWIESEIPNRDNREALNSIRESISELPEFSSIQTDLATTYGKLLRRWYGTNT